MITSDRALAAFFEELAALGAPPKQGANWIMGEVLGALSARRLEPRDMKLTAPTLARIIALVGQVMRDLKGKANPQSVNAALGELLGRNPPGGAAT